jgi:hypothetical protein
MQLITATGQAYPLKAGVNTVGRAADNDIALNDRSMSRRHAELHWDGEQCILVDLGSTNGTFLGGRRVVPHQPQALSPGVPLSFGPTMVVTLATGAGVAATAAVSLDPAAAAPAIGLDLMFRAMDVALDRRKLALAVLGFLAAGILGALLFWVFVRVTPDSVLLSAVVGLVGAILLWCILTFATATLSRLIFQELSEGKRETVRDALRYASQHFLAFLLSPLVLVIGLVLVLVGESVFLLLGRVQYVGELAVSLAFLPLVVLNLAVILVAWFGTALIYPTVADRGGGIVDTITSVLALVRRAPGRLVAYMMLAGITSVLMFLFSFYLIFAAVSTTSALAGMSIEADRFAALAGWLPLDPGDLLPGLVPGSSSGYGLREPPLTITIARFLIGLSLLGLGMVVLAIPQMFYLASTCAVYLNLRRDLPKPASQLALGSRQGKTEDQKTCWQCGALLAHDQTYCPVCKQLQG